MSKIDLLKNYNVHVDEALEFWKDMNSYEESLKEFKDSLDEKLKNLEYYKNTNDLENYGILAHSTKSEAKYLGFMDDAEIFLQHEMAGKENNLEFINNNFSKLEETITRIKNLLEEYFKNNDKHTIIIADDSNIMLNFIEKNIDNNFNIIRANDGNEAIKNLNSDIYAILLDLNMPTMNGFEVLEYMNNNNLFNKVPVIIITGDDTEETIKKAFSYPILDVLNKPFKEENINRILVSIKSFHEKR